MAGYVSNFNDLCHLVGHKTPTDADSSQSFFCFQKSVQKGDERLGFADVYFQGFFGWEYKGNHKDLDAAYRQLLQYRENLNNPPLLIVSDFHQIIIRTNFTNTVTRKITITLDDLSTGKPLPELDYSALEVLRLAFFDPGRLNPGLTRERLTLNAAAKFGELADYLRGVKDPARRTRDERRSDEDIARFLTRLIFCLFASDVGLLPERLITRVIQSFRNVTPELTAQISTLFEVMRTGGPWGGDRIPFVNGGLFSDSHALDLFYSEQEILIELDALDWSSIEPSIFGTLFERILDPSRRSQLGAHYTSRDDIETIVRPVLMQPLEREWEEIEPKVAGLSLFRSGIGGRQKHEEAKALLQGFLDRLGKVTVLDPACGSGNFLYVSLALLKDLEQRVLATGAAWAITGLQPRVHPRQLFGIEIDHYAHELASMVVWIGYLQAKHKAGIPLDAELPVLERLENIAHKDAILDLSDPANPREPEWPDADVIVGNPPFLGSKRLRRELGDAYVDTLFQVWDGRVRREGDLCVYWHEKARAQIEQGRASRAGLLATQAIRGGANRRTLERIKESGDIFFAISDRDWVLDGAAVHVSMVGFDGGVETRRTLDGLPVEGINPDLTYQSDLSRAKKLKENLALGFMGDSKVGPFDISP